MFKIGIIGCGKIAQKRHIPEYLDNKNAELVGYYDINCERAENLSQKYGGKSYDSYEALLADTNIDAVSICTVNNTHAEITNAALKAGKHVLCEKPMATTIEDCEAMVKTAHETGRFLMLGHNQRLVKTHVRAKELIAGGLIGDIVSFRTVFGHSGPETWSIDPGKDVWFFNKAKASMGVMADLGIHKTDLIHFLTDQLIVETTARLATIDKRYSNGDLIEVDDNAFCIYRLNSGAVGTMTVSWTFYGKEDNSTIIYGTNGIMRIFDDSDCSLRIILKDGTSKEYQIDQIQTNNNQTKSGVIDLFIQNLVENKAPVISGEEALKTMRVIFASIESSKKKCAVEINQH